MNFTPITQFSDFCAGLRKAGFSVGGSNSEEFLHCAIILPTAWNGTPTTPKQIHGNGGSVRWRSAATLPMAGCFSKRGAGSLGNGIPISYLPGVRGKVLKSFTVWAGLLRWNGMYINL